MKRTLLLLFLLAAASLQSEAQCTSAPGQPGPIVGVDPVCPGSTQNYYINAIPGATSYTWTLPSGWSGSSNSNAIVVTVGSTPGAISVFGSNDCGSGPSQVYNATIFEASAMAGGATTFCEGNTVVLNATNVTGYTYQWFEGVNPIAGANAASYSATESGTYTAHVSINGCEVTTDPIQITVNPTPVTPVAGSNAPICQGNTLGLTAYSTTPGVTYNWTGPNNFNTQNPAISNATVSDGGMYSVTASLNGCTSLPGLVLANILTGPPSQPGLITGPLNVCAGASETYSIATVAGATTYSWLFPTSWTPGISNSTTATASAGTNGGNVVVIANNACGNSPAQVLPVTVVPIPTAIATLAGATTFCQGDSVQLNANSGTGLTYQWEEAGNMITGANNIGYWVNAPGSYTVTVSNGTCTNTSAPVSILVNPLPAPVVTQTGNTLSSNNFSTYQWYMNGNPIPGATSQDYTPTQDGDYYVVVTDNNGCEGQSNAIQVVIPVSVNSISVTGGISLYPNPNDGRFIVTGILENDGIIEAEMTDVTGRTILSEQWELKDKYLNSAVNMSADLPAGVYTLRLTSALSNATIKFVKK